MKHILCGATWGACVVLAAIGAEMAVRYPGHVLGVLVVVGAGLGQLVERRWTL